MCEIDLQLISSLLSHFQHLLDGPIEVLHRIVCLRPTCPNRHFLMLFITSLTRSSVVEEASFLMIGDLDSLGCYTSDRLLNRTSVIRMSCSWCMAGRPPME